MSARIITFSNLFPSAELPTHGVFVLDRMRRVAAATGFELEVVHPIPRPPLGLGGPSYAPFHRMPAREVVAGVPVHHARYFHLPGLSTRFHAGRIARAALATVREIAGRGPCVVDAHYVYPDGVAALRIARELDLPCFVTARGTDLNVLAERPAVRRQIRAACESAAGLFAVSEALRRKLRDASGRPDEDVVLARNGVDLERFHPGDRAAARASLGLPAEGPLVCAVGRLIPGKGFHVAARALRQLPDAVHLVVVGTGPERERLERLAPPGRLHLLGSVPQARVAEVYRACDLLVLPSEREGWPNVVTEALASGLPVVATAVGAIPQILTSPRAGSLVRFGDADALAREIARFLAMPPDSDGIRAFAGRFDWRHPVEVIAARLSAALAARCPA